MGTIICAPRRVCAIKDALLGSGAFDVVQPNLSASLSVVSRVLRVAVCWTVEIQHAADDLAESVRTHAVWFVVANGAPLPVVIDFESSFLVVDCTGRVN